MKRNASRTLVLACLALCFFSNCPNRQSPVQRGIRDQILHVGNFSEPEDLDPHIVTGNVEFNIVMALVEGLVGQDPKDLSPVPGAAERWEISPDTMTYTFFLRPSGRWSNGDALTAHDFIYSFKRILTARLASEYAYMLYCMKNAEAYHRGEIADFSLVGVSAPDRFTLRISLARPTAYFLSLLQHVSWYPVHPPTIEKFKAFDTRGTRWTQPPNFVGNGPFVLKRWNVNTVVVVEKNPFYWDASSVRLNAIHFYPIESNQTEERAFRSGQIHLTYGVPLTKLDWYRTNRPELLHITPYLATYFYYVNVTRAPLNDRRVRAALAMTIDREALVKNVLKADQAPAYCYTPPNTAGYTCTSAVAYDLEKARALLSEAGYPEGKGFPAVELLYNTSETHHTIAQAVQEMWNKNLNISVSLVNQEWKVYLATTHALDYDIARGGWIADYVDPNTFLNMWVTGGGNNRTGYANPVYDSLIARADNCPGRQRRLGFFQQAEAILLNDLPIIPVFFYTNQSLIHPAVKGWYPTLLNQHPYKNLYLESDG